MICLSLGLWYVLDLCTDIYTLDDAHMLTQTNDSYLRSHSMDSC